MTNYVISVKSTTRYHTSAFCQALDPIYRNENERVREISQEEIEKRKLRLCRMCKEFVGGNRSS